MLKRTLSVQYVATTVDNGSRVLSTVDYNDVTLVMCSGEYEVILYIDNVEAQYVMLLYFPFPSGGRYCGNKTFWDWPLWYIYTFKCRGFSLNNSEFNFINFVLFREVFVLVRASFTEGFRYD